MPLPAFLARLRRDTTGAMAIETAIVAPVLVLMAFGSFQVSSMVARQPELQTTLAEAAAIGLASPPDTQEKLDVLSGILQATGDLEADQIDIEVNYRCGNEDAYVAASSTCDEDVPVWTFVHITVTDDYEPIWTRLGIGGNVPLRVERTVQIG